MPHSLMDVLLYGNSNRYAAASMKNPKPPFMFGTQSEDEILPVILSLNHRMTDL